MVVLGLSEDALNYVFNARTDPNQGAKANITATAKKFMVALSTNPKLTALQGHLDQVEKDALNLTTEELEATLNKAIETHKGTFKTNLKEGDDKAQVLA